jgi:hypothetical protein
VDVCTKAEGKGGVVKMCWKVKFEGTADNVEDIMMPKVMNQQKRWKN